MTKRVLLAVCSVIFPLALGAVAACGGGGTDLAVCNADCDNAKKCGLYNDVMTSNCHTDCNNNSGAHQQNDMNLAMKCSNVSDIRNAQIQCLSNSDACNLVSVAACQAAAAINDCLTK